MSDYKAMYYHLLRAQLKAIGLLENAHLTTETMYMGAQEPVELACSEGKTKVEESE